MALYTQVDGAAGDPDVTLPELTPAELAVAQAPGAMGLFEVDQLDGQSWLVGNGAYPPNPDEVALQALFGWRSRLDKPPMLLRCKTPAPHANADERPKLMAAQTPTGRACLRMGRDPDGTQTVLSQTSHCGALQTPDGVPVLGLNAYTLIWVVRIGANHVGDGIVLGNALANNAGAFQVLAGSTNHRFKLIHRTGVTLASINNAWTPETFQLFAMGWDSASQRLTLRRNRVELIHVDNVAVGPSNVAGGQRLVLGAGGATNAALPAVIDWAHCVPVYEQNLCAAGNEAALAAEENYAYAAFVSAA